MDLSNLIDEFESTETLLGPFPEPDRGPIEGTLRALLTAVARFAEALQ
jgi:hypothetical protein